MKQEKYWRQQYEKIFRELGNWGGQPSCDLYNYQMRTAAEMFFSIFEADQSYARFDECCDHCYINAEQRKIVRQVCEKHGMKEHKNDG